MTKAADRRGRLWDSSGFGSFWAASTVSGFGSYVTLLAVQVLVLVTPHGSAAQERLPGGLDDFGTGRVGLWVD